MAIKSYVVTGGRLNVRVEPSKTADVVKILDNEKSVGVYSIKDGWAKVKGGYCVAAYLRPKDETDGA